MNGEPNAPGSSTLRRMIDGLPGIYATRTGLDDALQRPNEATWIVFTGRRMRTLPPSFLTLKRARVLEGDDCGLTELPDWLPKLRQLRHLKLDENRLTTLPRSIGKCPRLRWLGLSQNALTSLPADLGKLTELRALWVDDNPRLTALPDTLFSLPRLALLDLTNTGIASLPPLDRLVGLKQLILEKTPLARNAKAMKALLASLPGATRSGATIETALAVPAPPKPLRVPRAELLVLIRSERLEDRANLDRASLDGERFRNVALKGQSLKRADLRRSVWKHCAFSVDLSDANLEGATFEDCLFEGDYQRLTAARVRARGAVFRRCTFTNVSFEGADLRDALLEIGTEYGVSLKGVDARGSRIVIAEGSIDAEGADLRRATLAGKADRFSLGKADLRGADASTLDAEECPTDGARIDATTRLRVPPAPPPPPAKTRAKRRAAPVAPGSGPASSLKPRLRWVAAVASEGGPLMVASAAALAGWGGAEIREGESESDYQVLLRRMKTALHIDDAGRAFWEAEPGVYAIGVTAGGNELVLLDAEGSDDAEEKAASDAARQRVEGTVKEKARGHLVTKEPGLAVVWSPIDARGLKGKGAVAKLAPGTKLVLRREGPWGVAVGLRAGKYAIATGQAEGHRWCRLRLV